MRTESCFAKMFVLAMLATVLFSTSALAASDDFSADLISKDGENIIKGKLFLSGSNYRMDMNEEGEDISIIVDLGTGRTNVLIHSQKMFMTIKNGSMKSASNNPFESYKQSAERYGTKQTGTEKINGYKCKIMEISDEGKKLMTAWVCDKFEIPLKLIRSVEPYGEMELKNIKEGPIDKSLFKTPPEYQGMNMPNIAHPHSPEIESIRPDKKDSAKEKDAE